MKMMKRLVALLLSVLLLCFVGCAALGPTMMKLGDSKITLNLFYLYLSRMKGTYCATYGIDAEDDAHWDTVMDEEGTTYNEHYTQFVLDQVKSYLAACHIFDEEGLELPDSTVDAIDEEIDRMIELEADGSKTEFNKILADYGANVDVLREAYLIEAKIAYLKDHLYGASGGKIGGEAIEKYYQDNYARLKFILFETVEYEYIKDDKGQDIYYNKNNEIAYDTTAIQSTDNEGKTIYVTEDGYIAYDKVNGTRKKVTTEDNTYKVTPISDERAAEIEGKIQKIYQTAATGNYVGFDSLISEYYPDAKYPNGYYVTKTTDTDWNEVRDKVFAMKPGEFAQVATDWGIYIVMRYELEEAGYDNDKNADFFVSTETGTYTFLPALKQYLLTEYTKTFVEDIKLDEAVLKRADMTSVAPNFYY